MWLCCEGCVGAGVKQVKWCEEVGWCPERNGDNCCGWGLWLSLHLRRQQRQRGNIHCLMFAWSLGSSSQLSSHPHPTPLSPVQLQARGQLDHGCLVALSTEQPHHTITLTHTTLHHSYSLYMSHKHMSHKHTSHKQARRQPDQGGAAS